MKKEICRGRRHRRSAKRIMSIILSLTMLFSITTGLDFSVNAMANSGSCGGNVTWTWDPSGSLRISGSGPMYDYSSKPNPFNEDNSYGGVVTNIVIDYGVTSIGSWVFKNCYHLESVEIPNSVKSIGESAFYNCNNLRNVKIPNSVTTLDECVFKNCTELISVQIPHSVTRIGLGTFNNCPNLKKVYYTGSSSEWGAIDKDGFSIFYSPTEATITYNYKCTSHSWDNGAIVKQPTCTDTGLKKYNCEFCKNYMQSNISALGHCYQYSIETAPTCKEDGIGIYTCSRCGDSYNESINALVVHQMGNWQIKTPATCETQGVKIRFCNNCDYFETDVIPIVPYNSSENGNSQTTNTETLAKLGAPSVTKLTKGKKAFTVKWSSVKGVDGYQIKYSLKKNFKKAKNKNITGATKTKLVVKKLKAKKTYYVRIRAYKTINGKKVYSKWSAKKKVRIK